MNKLLQIYNPMDHIDQGFEKYGLESWVWFKVSKPSLSLAIEYMKREKWRGSGSMIWEGGLHVHGYFRSNGHESCDVSQLLLDFLGVRSISYLLTWENQFYQRFLPLPFSLFPFPFSLLKWKAPLLGCKFKWDLKVESDPRISLNK